MSENHQFVENPLLLTDLFPKGVFYFNETVQGEGKSVQAIDAQEKLEEKNTTANQLGGAVDAETVGSAPGEKLTEKIQEEETMTTLTIINLLFDAADSTWDDATQLSYDKLMSAVKVNQEPVLKEDIESVLAVGAMNYNPTLLGDRLSPVIFVWTDQEIGQIPAFFKARPTEKGVMVRFPSFSRMCADVEMKKMVWQTMKQVLKF